MNLDKIRCACGHSKPLADPSFEELRAAMDEQERIIEGLGMTGKVETFFTFRWSPQQQGIEVRAMWMEKKDVSD